MELKNKALLQTNAFINNRWVAARAEKTFKVLNPANGSVITNVADCTPTETEMAIKAAHKAFPLWKNKTAKERGALMRKWFDLVMANADDLALLMTAEQGKPLTEAKGDCNHSPTNWCGRHHYSLEFSCINDHPQNFACHSCRLHGCY